MDLEKLNSLDINNAAQVKELQQFLKTRGYYNGPIDGKWGGGTTKGAVDLRADLTNAANTARDTAVANQQANDPTNNAIRGATEIAPYAVGFGGGAWAGHKTAKYLDRKNTAARGDINQIAANPKISGVEGERSIGDLRKARNTRTGLQFLAPGALFASAEGMRRYIAPMMGDKPEDRKWINLAANADQGAAIGLTVHQLMDLKNQVGPVGSQQDEALIRTRAAAERAVKPPAASALPPPEAPPLRTPSDRLMSAAKAAGAPSKGLNKTTAVEYLATNVTPENRAAVATELGVGPGQKITSVIKKLSASRRPSMIVGPMIAAGLGYDSASSEAEAAGASPGEARARGAVAGTGAAAATGGTLYGLNKLAQYAPRLSNALSMAGGMMMPQMAMSMGPEDSLEHQKERSRIAQNYPRMASALGIEDEMARVPERNPLALAGEQARRGPLMQASALEVPTNIPPNANQQADIAAGMTPGAAPNALARAVSNPMPKTGGPLYKASALQIPDNIPPNAARDAEMQAVFGGGRFPEASGGPGMPQQQGNALAQAGAVKDRFGLALDAFMAFVAEEQAAQEQQQPAAESYYGP